MLARRQVRLAVVDALKTIPNVKVTSPGDWPSTAGDTPELKCRVPQEKKVGMSKSVSEFTTTAMIEIEGRLQAATDEEAQDLIEQLGDQVENAVLCDLGVLRLLQQVAAILTTTEVTAEGRQHIAAFRMQLHCEVFEVFDPTEVRPAEFPALSELAIHVDTITPADLTGTYATPPFPASVTPAPRTVGPDGRDEGALLINLPS